MFKTITMVKLYIKQEYYDNALNIIDELLKDNSINNKDELLYLKALSLEGLDKNIEAENILFDLMNRGIINNDISELLQKINNKIGKEKDNSKENIPFEEIAYVYEQLNDIDMAIKYYTLKIEELQKKSKNNKN